MTVSAAGWLLADANDRVAVVDASSGSQVTYAELAARVDRLAEELSDLSGSVVLLGVTNSAESVAELLAFVGVGASVLLADPAASADSVEGWCAAYRPDVVSGFIHGPDRRQATGEGVARVEAVLLPTSGSTGSPKFVRLARPNLRSNAEQIVEALRISEHDRAFGHLPLFYSFGLSVLTSHLVAGASVVLSDASAIRPEFWNQLAEYSVTSLPGVPYSYEMFRRMKFSERNMPALMELTQAGGRLSPERVVEFHEAMEARGGRMWVMYGQTEASARISVLPPEELPDRVGGVGRALSGSRVWIDDPDIDGSGELVVEGPQVMLGYANCRDDIDGSDACAGVLRTGDVASVDADGWITITGRLKRMGKVFGARVNLDDVERALAGFGALAVVDDGDGVAVFVEGEVADTKEFARQIERTASLPPRSVSVHRLEELPTTAVGKIDYQTLRGWCE